MKRAIGILIVIFALSLVFALIVPDQRELEEIEEVAETEELSFEVEINAFNHIEYAPLKGGRYLAVLDPGGFEGERHGGALTIFDTFNGAVVERFDNVAGFAPASLDSSVFIFSARVGTEFHVFSYNLEDGLSADLNIKGGQGGIVLFENGELYLSSNALSRNYIEPETSEELNFFGVNDWAILNPSRAEIIDSVDRLEFGLDEVYPKIYPLFIEDGAEDVLILSSNNISLVKGGEKFILRLER